MNQLVWITAPALPALITAAGERAPIRFIEFFAAHIRNPHTRRAYSRAVGDFLNWCADFGVTSLHEITFSLWCINPDFCAGWAAEAVA